MQKWTLIFSSCLTLSLNVYSANGNTLKGVTDKLLNIPSPTEINIYQAKSINNYLSFSFFENIDHSKGHELLPGNEIYFPRFWKYIDTSSLISN